MLRGARRRFPALPSLYRRKSCAVSETPHYNPSDVEGRWAGKWAWSQPRGPKSYILSMFPYPSGRLHMGHVRVYTISDTLARYRRLLGEEVLHPMGWDAFGLPAENAAIDHGIDPSSWTVQNIGVMRGQLDRMGCHFDWEREVTTCSPDYYRWTQWLFLQLYNRGLAYKKKAVVNWDPVDGTVLANEQVDSHGRSWRSGAIVEQKLLDQWFFKITHYADALLEGLQDLDWPDAVKNTQAQWIGRSQGAYFDFHLTGMSERLRVFTTSQHTLYGVTFLAISPHHPLVKTLSASTQAAVNGWRSDDSAVSNGVYTGLTAVHPLTHTPLPVWVADYVLTDYGTGAVMCVPAHDDRDFLFATHHSLPVLPVVEDGVLIHSQQCNGLSIQQGANAILEQAVTMGTGGTMTTYKLRDWLISRQRYWGAPIPILYCDKCGIVPVSEDKLPVLLPTNVQFTGRGPSPLATNTEWGRGCCGKPHCRARKETDTMDTFVDSSWYFLRFTSRHSNQPFTSQEADSWMPVDTYVGGIEHAHLHLLYARFITHVLHDIGFLATKEPFQKLIAQGMVQGLTYREEVSGHYLRPGEDIKGRGISVSWEKMSKSKYNGVDPEVIVQRYGADAVRLFMLFKAPPELSIQWEDGAIQGVSRWLSRLWRMVHTHIGAVRGGVASDDQHRDKIVSATHKTIKQVTGAMEGRYTLNTALPELMILSNVLRDHTSSCHTLPYHEALSTLVLLLSPMAPHVSAELWEGLSIARTAYTQAPTIKGGVFEQSWPEWRKELLDLSTSRAIVLQVNGRKRCVVEVSVGVAEDHHQLKAILLSHALEKGLITSHDNIVIASNGLLVNIVSSS